MEEIIGQFVDISDCVEVVKKDLIVLEAAVVASECDRIDRLDNSFQCSTHLVIQLEFELGQNQLSALIQSCQISYAYRGIWRGNCNRRIQECSRQIKYDAHNRGGLTLVPS